MQVTRVRKGRHSHIEPGFNETWDDYTKLQWHAAVTAHDTGLRIEVHEGALRDRQGQLKPGWYSISIGRTSIAALDFHSTWTYLNGVSTGAQEAKRQTVTSDRSGPGSRA